MKTVKIISLLCLVALLGSCVKEELTQGGNVVEGEPAQVTVSLNRAMMGSKTRALTDKEEQKINNIHVLIFDQKGNIVSNIHFDSYADKLNVKTTSGWGHTIFVVANGDAHTDIDNQLIAVKTLSDLNTIVVANSLNDIILRDNGLMMLGQTTAPVNIRPGSSVLSDPIQLTFLTAKVTLELVDATPADEDVQVYGWDVVDAAAKTYLTDQRYDVVDPGYWRDFFTTANSNPFEHNDPANNTATQTIYLFENRRGGRVSRALPVDPAKRYPDMSIDDENQLGKMWYAPTRASYIVIHGIYRSPKGDRQFEARIVLGKDNHSNYDVVRGNHYIFTVTVRGINEIDVDSNVDYINAGFKVEYGDNLTMDAHPDFRSFRTFAPKGVATMEILDEAGRAYNEPGFSAKWLKISPLDLAYHQVKQAGVAGERQQDGVVGDFVRSKYTPFQAGRDEELTFADATYGMAYRITAIPFTDPGLATAQMLQVYADEFLEIEGTRTAQLKITYLKAGDPEDRRESKILTLTQRGPKTIFDLNNPDAGFDRLNEDGTPSGTKRKFIVEQFEEVTMALSPGIPITVQSTYKMQWGFYGVTPIYEKADKYRNGYFLTAEAVYNDVTRTGNEPTGFGLTGSSLKPKYNNGSISDIIPNYGSGANTGAPYYYPVATNNIYHPIYKSSAARYCHEKNRDLNGDGYIDASETKWYLPSMHELQMIYITNNIISSDHFYWSATQQSLAFTYFVGLGDYYWDSMTIHGTDSDKNHIGLRVRCVREID